MPTRRGRAQRGFHVIDAGHEAVVPLDAGYDRGRHGRPTPRAVSSVRVQSLLARKTGITLAVSTWEVSWYKADCMLEIELGGVLADLRTAPKEKSRALMVDGLIDCCEMMGRSS